MTVICSLFKDSPATGRLNSTANEKPRNPSFPQNTGREKFTKSKSSFVWVVSLSAFLFLPACSTATRYVETHEIANLKVVFLDEASLHEKWKARTGQPGAEFQTLLTGGMASLKVIKGFYDFTTDTLYCPKWNFEVCGHELHHAALGHFHPPH
ncbi:MAG: hypothetical protein AB7P17_11470 [Nitrospirales bacterium]|nr:hypothetical protein [Nitrospirales bacterium]